MKIPSLQCCKMLWSPDRILVGPENHRRLSGPSWYWKLNRFKGGWKSIHWALTTCQGLYVPSMLSPHSICLRYVYSHFMDEQIKAQRSWVPELRSQLANDSHNLSQVWEFPGCPMVRTLHCHCWGPGSIPGQGTKIPQECSAAKIRKKKRTTYITGLSESGAHPCFYTSTSDWLHSNLHIHLWLMQFHLDSQENLMCQVQI